MTGRPGRTLSNRGPEKQPGTDVARVLGPSGEPASTKVRKIYRFQEWPKQREASEVVASGRARYVGYGGAIGGGKTLWLLNLFQALARIFARSRWAIVRADLPTLKRTTIPSFERIRATSFVGELNRSDWTYYCANGSEILLFPESLTHDPTYERWKGLEVNGFGFDQAEELALGTFNMAKQRAGRWIIPPTPEQEEVIAEYVDSQMANGVDYQTSYLDARRLYGPKQPPPLIAATMNPTDNWPRDVWYDPWESKRLKAPYAYFPATVKDNPALPLEYIQSLEETKETDPQGYARFVLGIWGAIVDPRQVVQMPWVLSARDVVPDPGTKVIRVRLGVDVARFGANDSVVAIYEEYDDGLLDLVALDHFRHFSVPAVARVIRDYINRYNVRHRDCVVDVAGGLGAGASDMLREWGYEVSGFNGGGKVVLRGLPTFYSYRNRRSQSMWEFREKLQRKEIRISVPVLADQWRLLQKDLTAPRYDIVGDRMIEVESKEDVTKRLNGRSPDDGDAAIMGAFDMPVDDEDDVLPPSISRSTYGV
jgi:hypothetical protein